MAYTKTGGTCRADPTSQKPRVIVGLDRLKWRNSFHSRNSDNLSPMAACRGRAASMVALFLMLTRCAPRSKLYRTRPKPSPTHGRT